MTVGPKLKKSESYVQNSGWLGFNLTIPNRTPIVLRVKMKIREAGGVENCYQPAFGLLTQKICIWTEPW